MAGTCAVVLAAATARPVLGQPPVGRVVGGALGRAVVRQFGVVRVGTRLATAGAGPAYDGGGAAMEQAMRMAIAVRLLSWAAA